MSKQIVKRNLFRQIIRKKDFTSWLALVADRPSHVLTMVDDVTRRAYVLNRIDG